MQPTPREAGWAGSGVAGDGFGAVAAVQECPTCGARWRGAPRCHRCRTDLRQVLAAQSAAAGLRRQARAALHGGRLAQARDYAVRALTVHRCPESLAVRAAVALREHDFPLALHLWFEHRRKAKE